MLLVIGFVADAGAQSLNFDFGQDQESATGRIVQLILLLTVLSVAPAILMMVTAFTRIVVVLSILRRARVLSSYQPTCLLKTTLQLDQE